MKFMDVFPWVLLAGVTIGGGLIIFGVVENPFGDPPANGGNGGGTSNNTDGASGSTGDTNSNALSARMKTTEAPGVQ